MSLSVSTQVGAQQINNAPVKTTDITDIKVPAPEIKDKSGSMIANTLTGLGILGAATFLAFNMKKAKNPTQTLSEFKKLGGEIKKGIAKNKDGTLFDGTITHKDKAGNTYFRAYVNGRIQSSGKNLDKLNYTNGNAAIFGKKYTYDANGKCIKIERLKIENENQIIEEIIPKNIKTAEKFTQEGGQIVDGLPIKADGTHYNGAIIEKTDGNLLIKEFKDGKQISERYNATFKDRALKPDAKILDENGLIQREQEILEQQKEAERIAEEARRIAEEAKKPLNRFKNFFKNLFKKENN